MFWLRKFWIIILVLVVVVFGAKVYAVPAKPRRILLDTDVDTDDFFALLYLLKLNRLEFELEVELFSCIFCFVRRKDELQL